MIEPIKLSCEASILERNQLADTYFITTKFSKTALLYQKEK